jgi:YHS domain-containing protein
MSLRSERKNRARILGERGSTRQATSSRQERKRRRAQEQEETTMTKDPVCKMEVDAKTAAATSTYRGQTYFFCSKGCKEKFDRDPEKYAS